MFIPREIKKRIGDWVDSKEAIIIYGARQIGKTTFLKSSILKSFDALLLNCENPSVFEILESKNLSRIKLLFGKHKIICLDEAQSITDIGSIAKLIFDELPAYKLILTGSSSFDLSNKVIEPLTGRNITFEMYPISIKELADASSWLEVENRLNEHLVYGLYPEIINIDPEKRTQKLHSLSSDYMFKDILKHENLRHSDLLRKILKALAFQIGSEVSANELSNEFGTSRATIDRYLDLLEKSFIIFSLPALSRNIRNELKKSKKYYFYDNGMRNAIINNFNPIENRSDVGALWENFCVSERIKHLSFQKEKSELYFWRTYDQAEIDLIEEKNNCFQIWEFKWNSRKKVKFPISFLNNYTVERKDVINPSTLYKLIE